MLASIRARRSPAVALRETGRRLRLAPASGCPCSGRGAPHPQEGLCRRRGLPRASRAGRLHRRPGRTRASTGADRPPACGRRALRGGERGACAHEARDRAAGAGVGRRARGGGARRAHRAGRGLADRRLPGGARAEGRRRRCVHARRRRPLRHRLPRLRAPHAARRRTTSASSPGHRFSTPCAGRSATPSSSPRARGGSSRRSTRPISSSSHSTIAAGRTATTASSETFSGPSWSGASRRIVPVLCRRASVWCEEHGEPEAAIAYAHAAGDVDRLASLVGRHTLAAWAAGKRETVETWLGWFDESCDLERHPEIAVLEAWAHGVAGRPSHSERWLALAERATLREPLPDGSASIEPWLAVVRAMHCVGGIPQMQADAELALRELGPASGWRPAALVLRGAAHLLLGDERCRRCGDGRRGRGGREHRRRPVQDRRPLGALAARCRPRR